MHVAVFSSCCTCSIRGEHLGHLDTSSKYIHCISNSPLSSWSNPAPVVATQNESWHFSHDRDLKRGISMNQYDFACYTWILLNSIALYGATCLAAGFIYIYTYISPSAACEYVYIRIAPLTADYPKKKTSYHSNQQIIAPPPKRKNISWR